MSTSGGVWGLRLLAVTLLLSIGEANVETWDWRRMFVQEENPVSSAPVGRFVNQKFKNNEDKYMYRISGEGANTIFTVNYQGDVFVKAKLDREEKSVYHLKARLVERENSEIDVEEPMDLFIYVQDINDNVPVFQKPFDGSVPEMSPVGTTVMTLNATDKDDPSEGNGQVQYQLLTGTDAFQIDANTGVITTKISNLDRESTSEYKLTVKARDAPGQPLFFSTTTTITIRLEDINDNLSTFKTGAYTFSVREDMQVGFEIGRVEVEDKDTDENKKPEYLIDNPVINNMLEIKQDQRKNGVFTLRQPLDFESKSIYTFSLSLAENIVRLPGGRGTPQKTQTSVAIRVIDVDEPPRFDQQEYNITVDEEKFPFDLPDSVSAKDPDIINHPIKYSIEDSSCPVKIHAGNGRLSLKWKLDRELASVYRCQVTAVENIPDGKKGYAMLNLWVRDLNDNPPNLYTKDIYVCEGDGPGTVVGILTAIDKDERNGRFTFLLDKRSSNFSLSDNKNGTATLQVKQGRFSTEDPDEHVLDVKVRDGTHESIESLRIHVCTCNRDRIREYCTNGFCGWTSPLPRFTLMVVITYLILL